MQSHTIDSLDQRPEEPMLDLGIEELDEVTAPGFWEWTAVLGAGTIIGGGALYPASPRRPAHAASHALTTPALKE